MNCSDKINKQDWQETVKLTKALIRYPSITPEDKGCQEHILGRLEKLHFHIKRFPCENASNFWAIHGKEGPTLVFAGHTDVVPTGDLTQWNNPPFEPSEEKGLLYGRGAADMKGSLAAMLVAAETFVKDYPDHPGKIAFLVTSAEEGPSELGTPIVLEYLEKNNTPIDYCIVGEPTCENRFGDTVKIGRRGSHHGTLTIIGKQGHVAYPHLADNPIHHLGAFLQDLTTQQWDEEKNPDFPETTLQISNIHGGTGAKNVIPGSVTLDFNFRYSPATTAEKLENKVTALLTKYNLHYTLEWSLSGEPFLTKPGAFVKTFCQLIEKHTGIKPVLSTTGGISDSRFIAKTGAELLEFGPCNATIHQINEHVKIDDLLSLSNLYYDFLETLFLKRP